MKLYEKWSALFSDKLNGRPSDSKLNEYQAAMKAANDYNFMPRLWITGTILELRSDQQSGCAAVVRGELKATVFSGTMIPTGAIMDHPRVSIWSKEYWLAGPPDGFAARVIGTSDQIMKEFVNDWTASQ